MHTFPPLLTWECLPSPHENAQKPHASNNALGLLPDDPHCVLRRRLPGGDGVPLPGLHPGAPGAVSKARRALRGDRARAGLRVLPGVRPTGGRDVRRVHPEVLHRLAVLPDPRLGASPGATGAGPGAVPAQSGHRGGHLQPGAPGANQRSVWKPAFLLATFNDTGQTSVFK